MDSDKPKILVFTDWYLPGYKAGGPIKSCANLVAALRDRFRFYILCSDRDYTDGEPYPGISPNQWISREGTEVQYLSPDKQSYRKIRETVRSLRPDKVYINGLFSPTFSIYPLLVAKRLGIAVVVAPRGMLAPGAFALKRAKKRIFLSLIQAIGGYRDAIFHATDDTEAGHIRIKLRGNPTIHVIPNIPGQMPLAEDAATASPTPRKPRNVLNLLTVARIAPEKNIAFALECLRGLPDHIEVHHRIIGPVYDQDYHARCVKIAEALPKNVVVEFLGSMAPSEISGNLRHSHLFFLPTLGENYGHAIVEALLAGTPVLISKDTPWRDLEAKKLGFDLILKDRATFTHHITQVAEMNEADYRGVYGDVANRAKGLFDIPRTIADYQLLLN